MTLNIKHQARKVIGVLAVSNDGIDIIVQEIRDFRKEYREDRDRLNDRIEKNSLSILAIEVESKNRESMCNAKLDKKFLTNRVYFLTLVITVILSIAGIIVAVAS